MGEAKQRCDKMKTIVPASPGYFILAALQREGGGYRTDRTPVIAWRVEAADVEFDEREDAEAIGIRKFGGGFPQAVIGLDDKICSCPWDSSFEANTVEEWLTALAARAAK
jgi:hypothetical protein